MKLSLWLLMSAFALFYLTTVVVHAQSDYVDPESAMGDRPAALDDPLFNKSQGGWGNVFNKEAWKRGDYTGGRDDSQDISTTRGRLDFFREFAASIFGPDEASTVAGAVENKGNPAAQIIFSIVSILLSFLGGVSVLFGVYAAFLWMTAGGNEETIGKARTLLLNAVMGLVLILSALLLAIYLETTVAGVNRVDLGGKTGGFCSDDRGAVSRAVTGVLTLGATEIYCEGSYLPAAP